MCGLDVYDRVLGKTVEYLFKVFVLGVQMVILMDSAVA